MNFIKAGLDSNNKPIELAYQDVGEGKPVVLIHGWPVSLEMWEYQTLALARAGFRVVSYTRRGFGDSSKPWDGYDYDTMADDLKAVLDELNLNDVTLVGFSMGGGEVARYMSRHHGARIAKVVFVSAVPPFMLKTSDNPGGVDQSVFDGMIAGIEKDRAAFLEDFGKDFYGVGLLKSPVSAAVLHHAWGLAMKASIKATLDCVRAFSSTDFRADLKTIKVPTLVIHGDADQTVPLALSGEQTAKAIPQSTFLTYEGAPHGLFVTEKDKLNRDLIAFAK